MLCYGTEGFKCFKMLKPKKKKKEGSLKEVFAHLSATQCHMTVQTAMGSSLLFCPSKPQQFPTVKQRGRTVLG